MICKYKTEGISRKDFSNYQNLIGLFKNLRDGNITPKEVLKSQINFKSDLGEIKKRNPNLKPKDQISIIQNVENVRDYSFLLSEAKYKAKYRRCLKILSSKQMLQKSPIALAQIKAGSTSENLQNEIRKIINSLYQTK